MLMAQIPALTGTDIVFAETISVLTENCVPLVRPVTERSFGDASGRMALLPVDLDWCQFD